MLSANAFSSCPPVPLPPLSRSRPPLAPNSRRLLLRHQTLLRCFRLRPHRFLPFLRLPFHSSRLLRIQVPFPPEISKNCPSGFRQEYSPPSLARQGPRQAPAGLCRQGCSFLPRYPNPCGRLPRRAKWASPHRRLVLASAVASRTASEESTAANRSLAPEALALHLRSPCAPREWGSSCLRSATAWEVRQERSILHSAI